ncbi:hypothetical protein [Methylobacterium soli]|uniref:hypothetical protein n=1 Tax=Methylobacterium soli TaxID=553447 RepID=UPI0017801238|nr:hypothetical protein [Methylobacterium soli]GJE46239.1 hypothetical protein AEGHOMDF_5440 [Methylobacterium soli]
MANADMLALFPRLVRFSKDFPDGAGFLFIKSESRVYLTAHVIETVASGLNRLIWT